MTVASANKRRINVTFPEPLLEMLDSVIPPRERNSFIVEATERALRRERLLKAIERSSGAWSDTDYPELATDEDIDRFVHRLRATWMPPPSDETVEVRGRNG